MTVRTLKLDVNHEALVLEVPEDRFLIELLRDQLHLLGTHSACDTAQCGACTVLVDGLAVKSCNVLAVQVEACAVVTVEGLARPDAPLHPMQLAFSQHHGLQCGYCTPGFVMRAVAMATENIEAEPDAVRRALAGNLCRCTGYEGIVNAVCEGLTIMRAASVDLRPAVDSIPAVRLIS
jgi:aerobic carbon-monoxide dehydrogenase small subunit